VASVPNVFSPNENSLDEELCLFGADCIQGLSFKIFNRWGELIYESTDPKECWKGTYKEKLVSTGVYAYTLEATSAANEPIRKKGTITILK
jgi:gliding motility-associated-like protein